MLLPLISSNARFSGLSPRLDPVVTLRLRAFHGQGSEFPPIFDLRRRNLRAGEAGGRVEGRKRWLFHIFFHSCGKLRGETLRDRRGSDCSTPISRVTIAP